MLNLVVLVGRLTRDPELRYTPSGQAVASFTVAVDRPFRSRGEQQADFIDVTCWRGLAENVANHLGRGALVAVRGRIQVRSYETRVGQQRKATEVVADTVRFLEPKTTRAARAGSTTTDSGSGATGGEADVPF